MKFIVFFIIFLIFSVKIHIYCEVIHNSNLLFNDESFLDNDHINSIKSNHSLDLNVNFNQSSNTNNFVNLTNKDNKINETKINNNFDLSSHILNNNNHSSFLDENEILYSSQNNSTHHINITNHTSKSKCELITIPMCIGIGYNYTRMPNVFYHDSQKDAGFEVNQFYPLVQINCSADLKFFLCSYYVPICMEDYENHLPACKSVCERAKKGCQPIMSNFNFSWPEKFNCNDLPEFGEDVLCMDEKLQNLRAETNSLTTVETNIYDLTKIVIDDPVGENDLNEFKTNKIHNDLFNPLFNFNENHGELSTSHEDIIDLNNMNKIHKKNKKKNKQIINKKLDFINNLNENNFDSTNCNCQCRPPFIQIEKHQNLHYFNEIKTGGQLNCAFPCKSPYFTLKEQEVANFWITLFSFCCGICTLLTLLTFITDTNRFRYPERCIIFLSVCYLMISIGFILRWYIGHNNIACDVLSTNNNAEFQKRILPNNELNFFEKNDHQTLKNNFTLARYENTGQIPANCLFIFILLYFFGMCASVWWVILTLTWFLAAGLKWSNEAINSYSQYFHLVAWFTPTIKTIIIVIIGAIDGDPLTGICYVGNLSDINLLIFVIIPLCAYLTIGCLFLFAGFVSLFRIRSVIRQQTRNKTDKLEKLMVRIVIFSVLYIVPGITVILCNLYEYQNRNQWALSHNCFCYTTSTKGNLDNIKIKHQMNKQPLYVVFLIKYIMYLGVGITSGFWIWSGKTLQSWFNFYGRICCCFWYCGLCKKNKNNISVDQNRSNLNMLVGSYLASSNNQTMSNNQQYLNNNLAYKHLLNQQQHQLQQQQMQQQHLQQKQQYNSHLSGLKSSSGSNNGSSSTSHCKLPLSHV